MRKKISDRGIHLSEVHRKMAKPETPKALARAVKILCDKDNLKVVRGSCNVSNFAFVGYRQDDTYFDEICHAQARNAIGEALRYKGDTKPLIKWDAKLCKTMVYNQVKKKWEEYDARRIEEYRRSPAKKKSSPFRYYITWSNPHGKPEYWGSMKKYTLPQIKALCRYYKWLRCNSQWSFAFAGPSDTDTLFRCGCILDLVYPSWLVHFLAVAWRIPGEYIELVEEWDYLVQKVRLEPHFAFAAVQSIIGFKSGGVVDKFRPRGHVVMDALDISGVARMVSGWMNTGDLEPAKLHYDTISNYVFDVESFSTTNKGWLMHVTPKRFLVSTQENDIWGRPVASRAPVGRAFARSNSIGWYTLRRKIKKFINRWEKENEEAR